MSGLEELHKYIIKLEERMEKLEGVAFNQNHKISLYEFKRLNWPLILTAVNAFGRSNIKNRRLAEVFDREFSKLLSFLDGHGLEVNSRPVDATYINNPELWSFVSDNSQIKYRHGYSKRVY